MASTLQFRSENFLCNTTKDALGSIGYVYEGRENKPPTHRWRSLIERYICSEFAVYIRLHEGPLHDSRQIRSRDYGILLYWPRPATLQRLNSDTLLECWELKVKRLHQAAGNMERAMLVGVREFLQMPEGTRNTLPCSAVLLRERLLRLDKGDGVGADSMQELIDSAATEPRLILKDGKLAFRVCGCSEVIEDEKFPNSMVKGRSQVVNDFTNLNSPTRIGSLLNMNTENQFIQFRVELDPRNIGVSLEEYVNFSLQAIDLIPCPSELQSDAI